MLNHRGLLRLWNNAASCRSRAAGRVRRCGHEHQFIRGLQPGARLLRGHDGEGGLPRDERRPLLRHGRRRPDRRPLPGPHGPPSRRDGLPDPGRGGPLDERLGRGPAKRHLRRHLRVLDGGGRRLHGAHAVRVLHVHGADAEDEHAVGRLVHLRPVPLAALARGRGDGRRRRRRRVRHRRRRGRRAAHPVGGRRVRGDAALPRDGAAPRRRRLRVAPRSRPRVPPGILVLRARDVGDVHGEPRSVPHAAQRQGPGPADHGRPGDVRRVRRVRVAGRNAREPRRGHDLAGHARGGRRRLRLRRARRADRVVRGRGPRRRRGHLHLQRRRPPPRRPRPLRGPAPHGGHPAHDAPHARLRARRGARAEHLLDHRRALLLRVDLRRLRRALPPRGVVRRGRGRRDDADQDGRHGRGAYQRPAAATSLESF